MAPLRVLVVGAGLVGSLLAHQLAARRHSVRLIERRGDPRGKGQLAGRSINLAISARGFHALDRAGLGDVVRERAIRMPGRMIHPRSGEPIFQPYSRNPLHAIHSVSRSRLNLLLLEAAAAQPGVELLFDRRAVDVDCSQGRVVVEHAATGAVDMLEADLVVGADGAFSAIRAAMQKNERFDYSQRYLEHGYKELTIPALAADAESNGTAPHAPFAMAPNSLHIWPRGGSMMIALPNPDGSFTCTLFWPFEGDAPSFAAIRSGDDAVEYFKQHYPDAVSLMPTLAEDFERHPVGTMVTVRTRPWSWGGRTVLIGDAAHAIVPFYGQGANCGFEDVEALVDAIEQQTTSLPLALAAYESRRRRHADAIADMALNNFIEMRDKTANRLFRMRKRLDHALHGMVPSLYLPLYDMVSFTTIPYDDARRRARRQDRALLLTLAVVGTIIVMLVIALLVMMLGATAPDEASVIPGPTALP